jgi:hypothetical protein
MTTTQKDQAAGQGTGNRRLWPGETVQPGCRHCAKAIVDTELGWCHDQSGLYRCMTYTGALSVDHVAEPSSS